MRIVAGKFKGTSLIAPKGQNTRPTSDRVRESVFNILLHAGGGFDLDEARILDLFAGTGALGLEALSRGAKYCLFIDDDLNARAAIRKNVEALNLTGITKIWRRDATKLGPAGKAGKFDLVFLDPPYGKGLGEKALKAAHEGEWLSPDALCVLEERSDSEIELPNEFSPIGERTYGDTQVIFFRYDL